MSELVKPTVEWSDDGTTLVLKFDFDWRRASIATVGETLDAFAAAFAWAMEHSKLVDNPYVIHDVLYNRLVEEAVDGPSGG